MSAGPGRFVVDALFGLLAADPPAYLFVPDLF
jgi:hypothetical protein